MTMPEERTRNVLQAGAFLKELAASKAVPKQVREEAYRLGLATELVEQERLHARVEELAGELAQAAPLALGMTKRLFLATTEFDRFLEIESHVQNQLIQTHDHAEGVSAFLQKRQPRFTGR